MFGLMESITNCAEFIKIWLTLNCIFIFLHSISMHGVRVLYYIKEYCPIKDSSNMTISDWIEIALDIKYHYDNYDGFVVIHGTDTMAYSVSALSFMLENLGKSVVFTGSQVLTFLFMSCTGTYCTVFQ